MSIRVLRHVAVRAIHVLVSFAFMLQGSAAYAQVVNPADKAAQQPQAQSPAAEQPRRSYEMPPITVYGKAPLVEEDRIGDYEQPRWTAHRRFGETRVYVIPKGMVEFEYWMRPKVRKNGEPTTMEQMYEMEFGLPGRFQIDLYAVSHKTGKDGTASFDQTKAEVRWAFADWGKIWGNPTVYGEWQQESEGADVAELKLLLGGQVTTGWHWGTNLVWEHQVGDAHETSNEWTLGLSRTLRDTKVSGGVETQYAWVNEDRAGGGRTDFEHEFLIGPSFQFRPLPQMHLDLAPLFGVTDAAPRAKVYFVMGYEF
jgi:hypothetical protein